VQCHEVSDLQRDDLDPSTKGTHLGRERRVEVGNDGWVQPFRDEESVHRAAVTRLVHPSLVEAHVPRHGFPFGGVLARAVGDSDLGEKVEIAVGAFDVGDVPRCMRHWLAEAIELEVVAHIAVVQHCQGPPGVPFQDE